jgi:hypothetical protein
MHLCAYPHTPTLTNIGAWGGATLSPPQQQQKKAPNQKTKQSHKQKMGWEHSSKTHPHKERKTKLTKKKSTEREIAFAKQVNSQIRTRKTQQTHS